METPDRRLLASTDHNHSLYQPNLSNSSQSSVDSSINSRIVPFLPSHSTAAVESAVNNFNTSSGDFSSLIDALYSSSEDLSTSFDSLDAQEVPWNSSFEDSCNKHVSRSRQHPREASAIHDAEMWEEHNPNARSYCAERDQFEAVLINNSRRVSDGNIGSKWKIATANAYANLLLQELGIDQVNWNRRWQWRSATMRSIRRLRP